jgi:hypothetical protein
MNEILEPKPISCRIKGNTAHTVFLREDLRHYLNNTRDTILKSSTFSPCSGQHGHSTISPIRSGASGPIGMFL